MLIAADAPETGETAALITFASADPLLPMTLAVCDRCETKMATIARPMTPAMIAEIVPSVLSMRHAKAAIDAIEATDERVPPVSPPSKPLPPLDDELLPLDELTGIAGRFALPPAGCGCDGGGGFSIAATSFDKKPPPDVRKITNATSAKR